MSYDIAKLHAEGREFTTRAGRSVRILCTDRELPSGNYSVVALVNNGDNEALHAFSSTGRMYDRQQSYMDLVPVPVKKTFYALRNKTTGNLMNNYLCPNKSDVEEFRQELTHRQDFHVVEITWEE